MVALNCLISGVFFSVLHWFPYECTLHLQPPTDQVGNSDLTNQISNVNLTNQIGNVNLTDQIGNADLGNANLNDQVGNTDLTDQIGDAILTDQIANANLTGRIANANLPIRSAIIPATQNKRSNADSESVGIQLAGKKVFISAQYILLLLGVAAASLGPFEELYAWKQIDFQFPTENAREAAIASGDLIQKNNLPVGIEVWEDKLFVTIPRWKKGVPSNLNYISLSNTTGNKSPALTPYPDWQTNDIHQTKTEPIVNVFRLSVDACDRLWAIDSGSDDILGEGTLVTPVQLIVIDLKTDQIIRRYKLTESDQKFSSFFANIVVDVEAGACDRAFAYVSDLGANGLIVYSWEQDKSWRVNHNFFAFDPLHGDFNVSGINFQWTDGIFGMALSPMHSDGTKTLYFHALASTTEFMVPTSVLQDEALATSSGNYYYFKRLGSKGDFTQCTAAVMDWDSRVAFFAAVNKNGVACWDTKKPLDQSNFRLVAEDSEALVFPNDIKIARKERLLYVITDKMPIFQYSDIDTNQVNYRILRTSVDEAAKTCL